MHPVYFIAIAIATGMCFGVGVLDLSGNSGAARMIGIGVALGLTAVIGAVRAPRSKYDA